MPTLRPRAAIVAALCLLAAPALIPARAQEAKKKAPAAKKAMSPAPPAAATDKLKVPAGFKVELVYTVPRETQGSWVNLAVDPKGRLLTSDQYGKLYRVTPSKAGEPTSATKVEPIDVALGEAQGLLWAFDSLYVVVNKGEKFASGLYRVTDTNGDDALDKVELLRAIEGGGEHGPHAVVLAPDGKSLYVVAGNATKVPDLAGSLVPKVWGEDNLLPRMTDGNGFMAGEKAPGGFICKVSPDGKDWVLESMGYRNPFDMAFNRAGDLFTYDSDMEWDINTPWYRPTRVCMAASGGDFGYRNGAGKWPTYYYDSLPPVVNIGPGSPTGVSFGYGAKFPKKYEEAFFISDWSYGKLYAVHLKPAGSGYSADFEEFITGSPLPLTDLVVNPLDGAMYFAIGGRRTTSGLYRVTYTGDEAVAVASKNDVPEAYAIRRVLESFHGQPVLNAVEMAWPQLSHPDRGVRYAARVAIEFQPVATWKEKALAETNPQALLEALLALVHVSAADPAHRTAESPKADPDFAGKVLGAMGKLDPGSLTYQQKLDGLRLLSILFNRCGRPDDEAASGLAAHLDGIFPGEGREWNIEVCNLLVFLESPTVAAKAMKLLESSPTQEGQIDYARTLRTLKVGWTPELRRAYFSWLAKAEDFRGGSSFAKFILKIKADAVATLSDSEKADLRSILEAPPKPKGGPVALAGPARTFVKAWTLDELVPVVEQSLKTRRNFEKGRALFAAAACYNCHRYDNEGGALGPDLSGVSGRFSARDLLESIILPSKVISDQYGAVIVETTDGKVITGRIMNLHNDNITINTNMLDPNAQVNVNRYQIEETRPSPISMMPEGLLSTLDKDEVADLVAYLFSRGNKDDKMFH